ncbi:ParB N-terminal domain-containing protein [Citreicella sp. C3M06]|uniref:ParB N-terminal domain-containing protein n=1 Tax=Citreicella sp. C3M06 TaxID=2841564 RepID=UPI001C09F341|nr:ParB N-terminal domain-containing protein [Citreicella sp. C3M06]MBU2963494.1 ParB N-terminal domain-containing protein [Citreicella sp. C3M06]
MSKRKRLSPPSFLSAPETPVPGPAEALPGLAPRRRAAPIADVAADSSAVAALDELSRTMSDAREGGRMVLELPLEAVDLDHLVRDRLPIEDEDMAALRESLRARGQQMPIEVTRLESGRYGLISGWRRCHALRQLASETGEARFGTVLALLRRPDLTTDAYLAMVEENEIRAALSHYERARIVVKAVEQGVFASDRDGLQGLFGAASRAKRSKIGSFITIVRALDGDLAFPRALGERLGLALAKALDERPALAQELGALLAGSRSPEEEQDRLRAAIEPRPTPAPAKEPAPAPQVDTPCPGIKVSRGASGAITLSGAAVDDALHARLLEWLAAGR